MAETHESVPGRPGQLRKPEHAALWPDTAGVDARGRLLLGGVDACALAGEHGSPLYVYDEATIRAACQAVRASLAARWQESAVAYAGKAYLSPALCRLLLEEGMELDAVSAGEVGVALAAGFPPARIHLHGNVKPEAELACALEVGVGRIVVDSMDELERLEALARERDMRAEIWLRLCPDVAVQTHASIRTGHAGSKFGLELATGGALEAARRVVASPWLDLAGLHAHAGSQLTDVEPVERVVAFLVAAAAELRDATGAHIREISPGGGLGVAYVPGDAELPFERYSAAVADALRAACAAHRLAPPRLVVEPGRAIVARAGVALYTVGPRKESSDGTVTVAVDGGMGDNLRPALYQARYWAMLANRMAEPATERVRVVGRYCESGDVLVEEVALPRARRGDVLAIPVSGAYHLPMASNYNCVPRPAVVIAREGWAAVVRRRETLDDLLRLELIE